MKLTQEIKRKIIQIAAFGFSNSYVTNLGAGRLYTGKWKQFCNPGMNCYSCPAARFACPIGAMQAVGSKTDASIGFYALGFVLALGVIFGRAICGFICPFGFIQGVLHKIPFIKKRIYKPLTYIKYAMLIIFVFLMPALLVNEFGIGAPSFCKYICPVGTLEGGLPILLTTPSLRSMLGSLFTLKALILILTLIGCVIFNRFFCKVICPLGALYGLLNKISIYHMSHDNGKCIACGKCISVCPMDTNPVTATNSPECIRCGKCVTACPVDALKQTFKHE